MPGWDPMPARTRLASSILELLYIAGFVLAYRVDSTAAVGLVQNMFPRL